MAAPGDDRHVRSADRRADALTVRDEVSAQRAADLHRRDRAPLRHPDHPHRGTYVERGGTGLEIECPYYQIDVKIQGVATIFKSYLINRRAIEIGDKVRARFRTGEEATHTCLDVYWELV